jgi:phosphoribosylformimino-5-aminoimidazole carboxamide ribotide isomerase
MELIPSIDIRSGRCVRLLQGDFNRETRYDFDPRLLARQYHEAGANWLHIVDLDGAAKGKRGNADLILEIAEASDLQVQLGGGIRDEASLISALDCANRVVIGSLAVTEPETVSDWLARYGSEHIVLGLDVQVGDDGTARVATHGWTEASELTLDAAIKLYADAGLQHVLCTDIARDGAMSGPNVELYRSIVENWPDIELQASGGVSSTADLEALAETGVAAAISGKALLEKKIRLEEIGQFLPNA